MFTFSFSSAFAAVSNYSDASAIFYLGEAMKAVKNAADDSITLELKVYEQKTGETGKYTNTATQTYTYTIDYATLEANQTDILTEVQKAAKTGDVSEYVGKSNEANALKNFINTKKGSKQTEDTIAEDEFKYEDLVLTLVKAQFEADVAAAKEQLNSVSLADVSTDKMPTSYVNYTAHSHVACTTYKDHVANLIKDAVNEISEVANNLPTEPTFKQYANAKDGKSGGTTATAAKYVDKYIDEYDSTKETNGTYTKLVSQKGYKGGANGNTDTGISAWELNENYSDTTVAAGGVKLTKYLAENKGYSDAEEAAKKAALKAEIAAAYAAYVPGKTTAEKTYADNMKEAMEYLAENNYDEIAATNAKYGGTKTAMTDWIFSNNRYNIKKDWIDYAVEKAGDLKAATATLAAEVDSTGALVRDADKVADELEDGLVAIYMAGTQYNNNVNATNYKDKINEAYTAAETAIKNLYTSIDSDKLAYAKKMRETFVEKFLAYHEAEETYYPAELEKVKSLTAEYLTKVNAVTELKDVAKYDSDYFGTLTTINDVYNDGAYVQEAGLGGWIGDVKTATEVNGMTTNLKATARDFAAVLNSGISVSGNKYYLGTSPVNNTIKTETLDAAVEKLVGESTARTSKAITELTSQLQDVIKALPTQNAVDTALAAADDAVDNLPNTIKTSDKEKIDAAIAAVKAYEDLTSVDYSTASSTNAGNLTSAVMAYAYGFLNDEGAKAKAVSATDKAAIEAIKDEIDEFIDTYEDYASNNAVKGVFKKSTAYTEYTTKDLQKLDTYLDDIQNAAAKAVKNAIAAIPVSANITESAKTTVENARKLYDAYVAEYTDYTDYDFVATGSQSNDDGFVADDFDYAAIRNAETALDLNKEDPAVAVESLKLKASSTAKKGSITVKWTVTGDTSTVDGYEVWKSTKANKGYKKAFTTTKTTYKNTKNLKKGTRYYYKVRAYKMVDGVKVTSDWSNKAYRKAK